MTTTVGPPFDPPADPPADRDGVGAGPDPAPEASEASEAPEASTARRPDPARPEPAGPEPDLQESTGPEPDLQESAGPEPTGASPAAATEAPARNDPTDGNRPAAGPPVPVAAVHPRFRRRRRAVRRQAGLRRLRRLAVLVLVATVAFANVLVLWSPVFDVDEIAITGTARTDPAAIVEASGVGLGDPILLADLGGASEAIERLPWVSVADVRRELPGRVSVHITERTAAAVVVGPGAAVVVDATGRVLGAIDGLIGSGLVTVVAAADAVIPAPGGVLDAGLLDAVGAADALRDPPGAVAAIRVEPILHLQLVGGGVVRLGDSSGLEAKIDAFRTLWARVDRSCLATIDLEVPSHPVVTRSVLC